jgi:hypothetical protein
MWYRLAKAQAGIDFPLYHGSGRSDAVRDILNSGLIKPRTPDQAPSHAGAPSAAGWTYLTKTPKSYFEMAFPSHEGFTPHGRGALNYANQGDSIPHMFVVDPSSVDPNALAPDEDLFSTGITDALAEREPAFFSDFLSIVAQETEKAQRSFEREMQKSERYGPDQELQSIGKEAERMWSWLEEIKKGERDPHQALLWVERVQARLLVRWMWNRGMVSGWDKDQYLAPAQALVNKRIANKMRDYWKVSLDQLGAVRSEKPVSIQRALRRLPLPEGKTFWNSFTAESPEEMVESGEWGDV